VLVIACDRPEERDDLCAWAESAGLRPRVISPQAFSSRAECERDVVLRIGPYSREAHRGLEAWVRRTATIFICENAWDAAAQEIPPHPEIDCLCRPFARSELLWRAEGALCRVRAYEREQGQGPLRLGPLRYDLNLREVRAGRRLVDLRRAEREILLYLFRHAHRYVTTLELQQVVLGTHGNGGAVRTQIYEIRRKLARVGVSKSICCEPRKGYRLSVAAG
jgi:hypothetical protein